jgi:hypothetical protein
MITTSAAAPDALNCNESRLDPASRLLLFATILASRGNYESNWSSPAVA